MLRRTVSAGIAQFLAASAAACVILLAVVFLQTTRPLATTSMPWQAAVAQAADASPAPFPVSPSIQIRPVHTGSLLGEESVFVVKLRNVDFNIAGDVRIKYGDGTEQIIDLVDGTAVYTQPHTYLSAGLYKITATLETKSIYGGVYGAELASNTTGVNIKGPRLLIHPRRISYALGDPAIFDVKLEDANLSILGGIKVDLGDGSGTTIISPTQGTSIYSLTHNYNALGVFVVTATLEPNAVFGGVYGAELARSIAEVHIVPKIKVQPTLVQLPADGVATAVVTATVGDVFFSGIPNQPVKFTLKIGQNQQATDTTTDANGQAFYTVPARSAPAVGTLSVFSGGETKIIEVKYVAGAGQPANLSVRADPNVLKIGGEHKSRVSALVVDGLGHPIANYPVNFTTTAGSLSESSALTGPDGRAVVFLTAGDAPGLAVITARITTSGGDLTDRTAVFIGFRIGLFQRIIGRILNQLELPLPGKPFFKGFHLILPPDVVPGDYDLDYREITPTLAFDGSFTTTLEFELTLRNTQTGEAVQITKPITIIIDLDRVKLRAARINFFTLFLEYVKDDGSADTKGIHITRDAEHNQLIIVLDHLSRFRKKGSEEIKTYLSMQR